MQLMPKTAARFGVKDVFAIPENIRGVSPTWRPDQPLPRGPEACGGSIPGWRVFDPFAGTGILLAGGLSYVLGCCGSTVPSVHGT